MPRFLLLAFLSATPVWTAFAQTRDADWARAYGHVLARDWATADTALATYIARHGTDPGEGSERAHFWRCYTAEQRDRLEEARACYRSVAAMPARSRWTSEARTRDMALAVRAPRGGSRDALRIVSGVENGRAYALTLSDGAPDTLWLNDVAHLASVQGNAAAARAGTWTSGYPVATAAPGGTWVYPSVGSRDTLTSDERVALLAIDALGRPDAADVVPDLRRIGVSASSPTVQAAVVGALARIGTPDADRALLDLAVRIDGRNEDAARRLVSALALVARRSPDAALVHLERLARVPGLVVSAVQTLSTIPGDAATQALQRLADDASLDASKRTAAIGYLAERGDPATAERTIASLEGLARSGDAAGFDALRALARLRTSRTSRLGESASRALQRLGADATLTARTRMAAIEGFSTRDDATVVPLLVRLARATEPDVARSAVQALARNTTPEARRALVDLASPR